MIILRTPGSIRLSVPSTYGSLLLKYAYFNKILGWFTGDNPHDLWLKLDGVSIVYKG